LGFENVGDETLFWYAPWPEEASDGVRVTGWPRDRLGYFSPYEGGIWAYGGGSDPRFVSAPVDLESGAARLAVNVEGINEHRAITVEIQDHAFHLIAGYDRDASQGPVGPGLAQPIIWQGRDVIEGVPGPIRVRVNFGGVPPGGCPALRRVSRSGVIGQRRQRSLQGGIASQSNGSMPSSVISQTDASARSPSMSRKPMVPYCVS